MGFAEGTGVESERRRAAAAPARAGSARRRRQPVRHCRIQELAAVHQEANAGNDAPQAPPARREARSAVAHRQLLLARPARPLRTRQPPERTRAPIRAHGADAPVCRGRAAQGGNDRVPQALTTQCALGDELKPYVAHRSLFSKVNLCKAKGCKKVTWEAQAPGARLALCLNHSAVPPEKRYRVALGFQTSHRQNLPLFGEARLRCSGGCACNNATFNTLTGDRHRHPLHLAGCHVQQRSGFTRRAPARLVVHDRGVEQPRRRRAAPPQLRALIAARGVRGFRTSSEMLAATRNAPQQWRR